MGRFETLNDDTKDLVNCLLPALAASFGLADSLDIIPEDIRMRAWDCERRDHIKDETENDPRNWGVQFLKDLMSISRLTNGDLARFQADLRAKVALHEPKHPWARLADIRDIKDEYEHPERKNQVVIPESSEESSDDSYFEELVEPDQPKGAKRRRGNHEIYEARVLEKRRKRAPNRLRRAEDGGFERHDKRAKKRERSVRTSTTPSGRGIATRRARTIVTEDDEDYTSSPGTQSLLTHRTPAFSVSPGPQDARMYPVETVDAVDTSGQPLAVQKMQAELEVAEAELKAARVRWQYLQAKEQAEQEAMYGGNGTPEMPHRFD
ncbi:uncharacterized protein J4E87_007429 [Alternaria ethzedia]|uniref:uncharacterized protein n=1 Tax=Alternaria ethzedia TaxID=181014 RepID=UPI0020C26C1B|nr:uncharacterized protein J4E87_007429 [Alternaria ethzedia]KAI4619539.1 hypothetical protein J4E87_007429 [Alternaria ethzedia]